MIDQGFGRVREKITAMGLDKVIGVSGSNRQVRTRQAAFFIAASGLFNP